MSYLVLRRVDGAASSGIFNNESDVHCKQTESTWDTEVWNLGVDASVDKTGDSDATARLNSRLCGSIRDKEGVSNASINRLPPASSI